MRDGRGFDILIDSMGIAAGLLVLFTEAAAKKALQNKKAIARGEDNA
jgi:hypothetical protein